MAILESQWKFGWKFRIFNLNFLKASSFPFGLIFPFEQDFIFSFEQDFIFECISRKQTHVLSFKFARLDKQKSSDSFYETVFFPDPCFE